MASAQFQHYLKLLRTLPPDQVVKKGAAKIRRTVRHSWQSAIARLLGTGISDRQFQAALRSDVADAQAMLSFLRSGAAPAFLIDSIHGVPAIGDLRKHSLQSAPLTIASADRICAHVFNLLGSGPVAMGDKIDWHVDFKTGHHYNPRQYYANIHPANYPGGHDIKVPWELSRCQHFVWLGQAYWYTGDEKYAREFVAQVTDWIEANPPKSGVNWACTMDVAIRAVNWLWGYHFFKGSPALTDEFLVPFNKTLLAHGRHIINNLERSDELTANHYLSDIVGLVYLGLICPQFTEAQRWREFGLHELWREIFKQVYADGVDFEASISYHRLAAELFLSPILLCRLHGVTVPDDVMARLEKMLEFVMHYTKPDGTVPLFGDCDNGRLHRLKVWAEPEREWIDHRYLLAIGAVLFERDDFGLAAGDQWEEAFWLCGEQAIAFKEQLDRRAPPPLQLDSRAFPDGGLYIMRGEDNYMIVDAGSNGQNGVGGHAHNDTLSFEFYAQGQSWIVDPGAYIYTADYTARNQFRSSRYHNVLTIDDQEINRFDAELLFQLSNGAKPAVHRWMMIDTHDTLVVSHNGYERFKPPVSCKRCFYFDKQTGCWLIRDEARSESHHTFAVLFHFAPSMLEIDGPVVWVTPAATDTRLAVCLLMVPDNAKLDCHSEWISSSYGRRTPAPVLSVSGTFNQRLDLAYQFFPYTAIERPSREQVLALGKRIFLECKT